MSGPVTPEPHIVCPRCSYQIPLTGSLAAPLPEAARKEFHEQLAVKETEFASAAVDFAKHAPTYSITSSARPSIESGTLMPSALAAFRLTINWTFVDCCTGKSAGLSPFNILPARIPAVR